MAQRTQIILIDDLDGKELTSGGQTVRFGYDGVEYSIDLSDKNAAAFRDSLAQYVGLSRRVGGRAAAGRGTSRRKGGDNRTAQIREWARSNGHKVNERGRIPATVVEAYDKAH